MERVAGVTLALGGGGARGLAHVGVLRALQEAGVPVAGIAGTSIGAIVGGLFAAGVQARAGGRHFARLLAAAPRSPLPNARPERGMHNWFDTAAYLRDDLFGLGHHDGSALEAAIEAWVGPRRIEELELPFVAVATDVRSGAVVSLDRGPLARALHASAAMPGVYQPVTIDGRVLMDGGVVENIPVVAAGRLGGTTVLAVSVSPALEPQVPRTGIGLLARAEHIRASYVEAQELARADLVVHVPVPDSVGLFDFDHVDAVIALGRSTMQAQLGELRDVLARA